jgi:hypothetical protein
MVITAEHHAPVEPLKALGVKEVVSKPFDLQFLLAAITPLLGS